MGPNFVLLKCQRIGQICVIFLHMKRTLHYYRPHPKDGEGNVFSLSTLGGGGQVRVQPGGGVRSESSRGGGVSGQSPAGGGGVRSESSRGGVQSSQGVSQRRGGSASCALLRAVCLLRSRRKIF